MRDLLSFIGVIGLAAVDTEEVSVAVLLRFIFIDGDVSISVSVFNVIGPFGYIAIAMCITVGYLPAMFGGQTDLQPND